MDFFTVPTATFGLLYCFFIIRHEGRRILHFNVTKHPTTQWIIQQLREAFPFDSAPRFLIFDRYAKYGLEVQVAIRFLSIRPVRTPSKAPALSAAPAGEYSHLLQVRVAASIVPQLLKPTMEQDHERNLCGG